MRLTVGSLQFSSTFRELTSSSRNLVISCAFFSPMLPDESRANTMSEPREQSVQNHHQATDAGQDCNSLMDYIQLVDCNMTLCILAALSMITILINLSLGIMSLSINSIQFITKIVHNSITFLVKNQTKDWSGRFSFMLIRYCVIFYEYKSRLFLLIQTKSYRFDGLL